MTIRKYSAALIAVFLSFATSIAVAQSEDPVEATGYFHHGSNLQLRTVKGVIAPLDSTNKAFNASISPEYFTVFAVIDTGRWFYCRNAPTDAAYAYNAELARNFRLEGLVKIERESLTSAACKKMTYYYSTPRE